MRMVGNDGLMVGIFRSRFLVSLRKRRSFSIDLMTEEMRPKADFRIRVASLGLDLLILATCSLVISLICREAQPRRERLMRMRSTPAIMSAISR